jgi:serine protease Do
MMEATWWSSSASPTPTGAEDLERAFERAAHRIAPSVVSIIAKQEPDPQASLFMRRFGRKGVQGLGSGVIVDEAGYILTNNHVVAGADALMVRLHDDREVQAVLVGADEHTDLAVVKIEVAGLRAARISDGGEVRVGQWVLAVGSPFGLSRTVTAGIVSAKGRGNLGLTDYGDFIQTDAAINQGNSGGPLIDLEGRVVGINTAMLSPSGGNNGVGFAIPSHLAALVKDQLVESGIVRRGWLGVVPGPLTPDLVDSFDFEGTGGVLVDDVEPEGPGHAAGIRPGDIITSIDGDRVEDVGDFRNRVAQMGPGVEIRLELWRDGGALELPVVLALLPGTPSEPHPRASAPPQGTSEQRLGLFLRELDARSRRLLKVEHGALVLIVEPGSIAEEAGLIPGDVLVGIGEQAARSAAEAERMLTEADFDEGVRVRVHRDDFGHFAVLRRHSR